MVSSKINTAVAQLLYEESASNMSAVIVLEDGSLFTMMALTKKSLQPLDRAFSSHYVMGRQSFDQGKSWTKPEVVIEFPQQQGMIPVGNFLQSKAGFVHVFSIRIVAYHWDSKDFRGDILHTRMDDIHGTHAVTQKVACLDRHRCA